MAHGKAGMPEALVWAVESSPNGAVRLLTHHEMQSLIQGGLKHGLVNGGSD